MANKKRQPTWKEYVNQLTLDEVMRYLGAPRRTVYAWREGKNTPSVWQQIAYKQVIDAARAADAKQAKAEPVTA